MTALRVQAFLESSDELLRLQRAARHTAPAEGVPSLAELARWLAPTGQTNHGNNVAR
jgi:hypothetical protein